MGMSRSDAQISTTIDRDATDVRVCLTKIDVLIRRTWPPTIRLELHTASGLPRVRCDPLDLQTAIMNLAFNARDAMPNGGVTSIIVSHIATQIEVRVTDNGIGMTRETLARAFDPFFTTKAEGLGGLGLPIVQRFARETGGQVEIESELGEGTTVTLRLPISDREPQADRLSLISPQIRAMRAQSPLAGAFSR
jgi:signal transduction histidine kinase